MISKTLDDNTVSFIAEESDDLLTIRRLIKKGDKIVGETTRVIKQEKEYSRPDKGERIRIRLAIEVEKVSLDDVLDRIRVGGTITESNNDAVPHGSHHSFIVKIDEPFNLVKKEWATVEKKLAKKKQNAATFVLVAIDTGDCGIGKLKGTHIIDIPIYWQGLVDYDTITVNLTPCGKPDLSLYVKEIRDDKIILSSDHLTQVECFYHVWGNRIGPELHVEYDGESPADYPGDQSGHSIAGYTYDKEDA